MEGLHRRPEKKQYRDDFSYSFADCRLRSALNEAHPPAAARYMGTPEKVIGKI
jgi:hypothetical protein